MNINEKFEKQFHKQGKEYIVYGRAELSGNHTDHQKGKVLACTINIPMKAVATRNETNIINIYSEGFGLFCIDLDSLQISENETGTTQSLIKGIASMYKKVSGFDAYIESKIKIGSGISSSAAFEILLSKIIEDLFDEKTDTITMAQNAQYVENKFYKKPCGLMDQLACAYGGIIMIDFSKAIPKVDTLDFDFEKHGYSLCIVDSKESHESLTEYYEGIVNDLKKVSNYFFQDNLSSINKTEFINNLASLRNYAGDRACLRAMHVFNENFRVSEMYEALLDEDMDEYLKLVNESGNSSWMLLQNVIPSSENEHQGLAFAISISKFYLKGQGACRLQGGGFAGTLQCYVPNDMLEEFCLNVEKVLGKNTVTKVRTVKYEI